MGLDAEGFPLNLSAGSMRKSVMYELCEDRQEHESKKLRLMGGVFALFCTWKWAQTMK